MARRDSAGIRLTRNGHDWSPRYPVIRETVNRLKVRSCLIDDEAVACDENGLAVFERLRRKREGRYVFLYAFDLLELNFLFASTYAGLGSAGRSLVVLCSSQIPRTK